MNIFRLIGSVTLAAGVAAAMATAPPLWWARTAGVAEPSPVVAVGPSGEVFQLAPVLGASGRDIQIVKYSPAGVLEWTKTYTSPIAGDDFARDATVDPNGNLLMVGASPGAPGDGFDGFVARYSSTGTLVWRKTFDGFFPSSNDRFDRVIVMRDGSLRVFGTLQDEPLSSGTIVSAYTPGGVLLWRRDWSSGNGFDESAVGIHELPDLSVIVSVRSVKQATGDYSPFLYRVSAAGSLVWARTVPVVGSNDILTSSSDAQGRVFFSGEARSAVNSGFFGGIDPLGNTVFTRSLTVPSNEGAGFFMSATDPAGNTLFGNAPSVTGGGFTVVRFNSAGVRSWVRRYSPPVGSSILPIQVQSDGLGCFYVARIVTTGSTRTLLIDKISPGNAVEWTASTPFSGQSALGFVRNLRGDLVVVGPRRINSLLDGMGVWCFGTPVSLFSSISNVRGATSFVMSVSVKVVAPPGGQRVDLTDNSPFVTVPPTVVIPAGQRTANFTVQTSAVTQQTIVNVLATTRQNTTGFRVELRP